MSAQVTVVVVPRDRFSSVIDCTQAILDNTPEPIHLVYLDFGYSPRQLEQIRTLAGNVPLDVVPCGRTIPMTAFRQYLPQITTPYVAWVDNDTYVQPRWLTACLAQAAEGARVILPLTLEREGLDIDPRKIPLRNHISHAELRGVEVQGETYVFDYKPFRRAAPEELPQEPHTIDFFELHTFFAETDVLRELDLPDMVVREHVDIGIQLNRKGIPIWSVPQSIVHFDNIHERPTWRDLKFFFFRWDEKLINQSHQLFLERWGYRFYNEQFMKNWACRRKVYSICRFLGIPSGPSDFASRVFNKLFRKPIPKELSHDPFDQSYLVLHDKETSSERSSQPQAV
jgi:GT2 family glycosyltransferase